MLRVRDFLRDQLVLRRADAPTAPAVSVVLPTWRRCASGVLRRAIESVLEQEHRDLELIVVDDGSTDGTCALLRELQVADPRLAIVRHELNSGLPALRVNEGIELGRGRFIAFQMDDDEWLPGALGALVAGAEASSGEAVVYGKAELRDADGVTVLPTTAVDRVTLSYQNRLANNAVLVPAELFRRGGMYDPHVGMRRLCDWDLWMRLTRYAEFVGVDRLVARVTVAAGPEAIGVTVPADLALFRYLQSIDRDRLLAVEHWRDYELDALEVGGVPVPGTLGERLLRQQVEPWRARRAHAFLHLPATQERPASAPRRLLLTSDAFYNALDLCFLHYDEPSLARGGCKQLYMPLLQRGERWAADVDLVLVVRATTGSGRAAVLEAGAAGRPVGYYLDDDLLHLHEHGEAFAHLAPGGEQYSAIVEQLRLVDAVWSTSPVITEAVLPHNPRVVPHNGSIPESWLPRELPPRAASGRLRIGYVGNAFRSEEFALLWDGLRAVARRHRDAIELEFWGLDPFREGDPLPSLDCPVRHRPFAQSFALFGERLRAARFDVLLTPLLEQPRARRAKAPSKYYLAAAAGALGIFSDVEPYAALPHGVSCLKAANTAAAWEAAIEEAIGMPAARFDAMRRAGVEHVRLEYTEAAQIHLHEAAVAATELHHATRHRRVDGRPLLLVACAPDDSPRATRELLRRARLARDYGFAVRALCAGDAIGQQAAFVEAGVRWDAVSRRLLANVDPAGDPWPVRNFLAQIGPAVVQGSGPMPLLATTCARLGLPWVPGPLDASVEAATFRAGLLGVLADVARTEPPVAAAPRLVMIGDLAPTQRQLDAIEAVALWPGSSPPRLELWSDVGGDPVYANRCRRRVHELGVADRVRVLRRTGDVGTSIAGAYLLLELAEDPELSEAVALALAAGVPVLTASAGAFAAGLVDGVTAFRLEPSATGHVSVDVLLAAVARVLADADGARAVAHAGHAWARATLHPQRAASSLLRRYLEAVRPPVAPPAASELASPAPSPDAAAVALTPPSPVPQASRRDRLRDLSKRAHLYRPLSRLYWRGRRRRVLVVSGPSLSAHLYYELAHEALEAASGRRWVHARPDGVDAADLHSYHAVVLMLARSERELALLRAARRAGCLTIYDTDDHLLRLAEVIPDAGNPWRRQLDAARPTLEALQREADVIKVYSRSAVPLFRELNPNVAFVRAFQPSLLPLPAPAPGRRPVKVGFLGSLYKDEEFAAVVPALRRVLDQDPGVVMEFFGFLPAALRDDPRVAYVPLVVPWEAYRAQLQALEWDVALAPLRDLPYNRCKNEVKYREYASAGIAGVYADMPVYSDVVRHGENGLLVAPDDDRAWEEAILQLVRDEELRRRLARNAHADVAANFGVEAYAAKVAALLESPRRRRPVGRG